MLRISKPFFLLAAALLSLQSCDGHKRDHYAIGGVHSVRSDAPPLPSVLVGNDNVKFGFPGGNGVLLVKKYYVVLYDTTTLVPEWVTYHLSKEELKGNARRVNDFRPDSDLPVGKRSELEDYRNSGYDRGHMAPAADFKRNSQAMWETFLLSNMAPQRPRLNRGIWSNLEEQVRLLAKREGDIWIFTGPLYLDSLDHRVTPQEHIGPHKVAVPTHFFKAILCELPSGGHEMFAFIVRNQATELQGQPKDYLVSVHRVEESSGLNFFSALPEEEERRLESEVAASWPVQ